MLYRALIIGINAYPNAPLQNCVNDAEAWAVLLERTFGWSRRKGCEIRLLCDARATASNIHERLEWLAQADRRVLFQSGHGAQMADYDGDELDRLDELFCPVGFDWTRAQALLDDDYHRYLTSGPPGARTVFVSDSCHSGDLARASRTGVWRGQPKRMQAPLDIAWRTRAAREDGLPLRGLTGLVPEVVAISACRSDQVAMDGNPGNGANGALTWALVAALRDNPGRSLTDAVADVNGVLGAAGYQQEAQITGPEWKGEALFRP